VLVDVEQAIGTHAGDMAKINWTLQTFRLDELTDYYKNPRSLSEKEFKQLKTSLDKFGMIDKPIVNLDSAHTVIGGHQRKHVLEAEGVKEVECWIPDRELSDKEVEELNIRLNKNTGSWDFDTLANEFELDDLLDWGFDKGELDLDLWADEAPEDVEPQIDKAEELREKWGVESGQLWQLGEHRLICGDCTDKAVVERVMGGERAEMVFTDPPYNIGYDYWDYLDNKNAGEYKVWCEKWFRTLASVSPLVILTVGQWNIKMWYDIAKPLGTAIWVAKNKTSGSKIAMFSIWEPILIYGKKVYRRKSKSDVIEGLDPRKDSEVIYDVIQAIDFIKQNNDVFEINNIRQEGVGGHSCPKQLSLIEEIIRRYSDDKDSVLDIFLGSGTTLIACERLNRKCRAVEISPAYCAVAIQRWVDVTGGEPVLVE
jgi:DNA modification methylase